MSLPHAIKDTKSSSCPCFVMRRKSSRLGKNNDCLTSHGHETIATSLERVGSVSLDVSSQQCRDVIGSRVADDDEDDDDDDYTCQANRSRIDDGDDASSSSDTEISVIDSDGDDNVLDGATGEYGCSDVTANGRPRRTAAVQLREIIAMATVTTSSTPSTARDTAARSKSTMSSISSRGTIYGCENASLERKTEPPSSQANCFYPDLRQSMFVILIMFSMRSNPTCSIIHASSVHCAKILVKKLGAYDFVHDLYLQ
jgi:hypothetical protein